MMPQSNLWRAAWCLRQKPELEKSEQFFSPIQWRAMLCRPAKRTELRDVPFAAAFAWQRLTVLTFAMPGGRLQARPAEADSLYRHSLG